MEKENEFIRHETPAQMWEHLYRESDKKVGELCQELGGLKERSEFFEASLAKARKEYYLVTGECNPRWPYLTYKEKKQFTNGENPFAIELDKTEGTDDTFEISIDEDYLSQLLNKKPLNNQHNGN